ncbi:MAG: hypothetical protein M0D55_06735 [Elusimicrobiota bacterium]|nr:MAG: hypothetical protein M0D55_06735 [Elusimicrobiota bacterium]
MEWSNWIGLLLALAAAPAAAAGFGDASIGAKPYGVLLLTPDDGGAWKSELGSIRAGLRGVPVESVETSRDGAGIQRQIDRLRARRVSKIVVVPLEPVSEAASMGELRYLLGMRAAPARDRPDAPHSGMAPFSPVKRSTLVIPGLGRKRLSSEAELVLAATIDKSPALADILAARATALARDPAKEAVVLVGLAPRSDKGLEAWKTAANAIAEAVRVKGAFREAAIIRVRDGTRAGQKEADRAENMATLRRLTTQGGVAAVPLALDGRRVGKLLQRQLGGAGYSWNGKGILGDPRLTEWILSSTEAASAGPKGPL